MYVMFFLKHFQELRNHIKIFTIALKIRSVEWNKHRDKHTLDFIYIDNLYLEPLLLFFFFYRMQTEYKIKTNFLIETCKKYYIQ